MPTIEGFYVNGTVYNYEDLNIASKFQNYKKYVVDDLVLHDGILYRCKVSHVSGGYFDTKKWEPINLEDFLKSNYISLIEGSTTDLFSNKRPSKYDFTHIDNGNYFTEKLENNKTFRYTIEKNSSGYISKVIDDSTGFETDVVWPNDMGSTLARKTTIVLSSNWNGSNSPYSQTITMPNINITSKSYIYLCPNATQLNTLIRNGVEGLNVENNNSILTAYVIGQKPSTSMEIQCIIQETL